jgi:hypothetical protein
VWEHHVPIALESGLSESDLVRVRRGPHADWPDADALLVRAADELIDEHRLGDATWKALGERFDAQQLIEVPMVVGVYYTMGFTINSLGIQLESGVTSRPA